MTRTELSFLIGKLNNFHALCLEIEYGYVEKNFIQCEVILRASFVALVETCFRPKKLRFVSVPHHQFVLEK